MLTNMTTQQAPVGFNKRVGQNIQQLRKAAGLSQEDLGQRLALHGMPMKQQTILTIEGGSRPLKWEEGHAIAAVLGVDPESLTVPTEKRVALLEELRAAETAIVRCDRERQPHQYEINRLNREIERQDQRRHKAAAKLANLLRAEDRPDLASLYADLPPIEELITTWEQTRNG
jgi:transcriptional regulator with XRE-family HTH domain